MIENFSKWLELVLLLDNNSEGITYAFLNMVFGRFGIPTKVLTDQSTKFHGEFQELCEKTLINHNKISPNHLETEGLMERMVQTMKWGL
jgi:hypothetical protein